MKNFRTILVAVVVMLAGMTDCFAQIVYTTDGYYNVNTNSDGNTLISVGDPSSHYGLPLNAGGYSKVNLAFLVGYVNKSCICKFPDGTKRIGSFFTDREFLHGAQLGVTYTPSFDWGLGLRTGVFFEFYECNSPLIDNRFPERKYPHYTETDIYLPLHATYRIPFAWDFGLTFIGGMGYQHAFSGRYMERYAETWRWKGGWSFREREIGRQEFGNGGPQKDNWQAEVGFNLRYKWIGLNFLYSFGVVDHRMKTNLDGCGESYGEPSASFSRQDKMQVTISLNLL